MSKTPGQILLPFEKANYTTSHLSDDPNDAYDQLEETQRQNLEKALSLLTKHRIALQLTDNSNRMISVKSKSTYIQVRLHHMFLEASPQILEALASYIIVGGKQSSDILNEYIKEHADEIAPPPERKMTLRSRGKHYNLNQIYNQVNNEYFENKVKAQITWGRDIRKKRRHVMQMGSYCSKQDLIRIHPALDQHFVPDYYIRWVVYHEMLHAYLGTDSRSAVTGKRMLHSAKFEFAEQRYKHYHAATAWEKANLKLLMRY